MNRSPSSSASSYGRGTPPGRVRRATRLACAAGWIVLAFAAGAPARAAEQPHQHGLARLDVAVDAKRITLLLDSPLDNLLGFERAARTAAERRDAAAAVARLKAADTLFRVDPAAGCTLRSVAIDAPVLLTAAGTASATAAGADSAHADLEATIDFDCRDAARAAFIDTALFGFAPLRRVEVQVSAPAGQFQRVLTRDAKRPLARIVLTK